MTVAAKGVYIPSLEEKNPLNLVRSIQQLARGQTNARGSVTLSTAGATTTTVSNVLVGPNTIIKWQPTTLNAAGAMTSLYCPSTNVTTGQFILVHSSSTTTDRVFNYVLAS